MQRNSKIISAALGVFLMLIMSSCGFKPMYGANSAGGSGLYQVMANIEIDRIRNMQGRQERLSQLLQNNLIERISPLSSNQSPHYTCSKQTMMLKKQVTEFVGTKLSHFKTLSLL